MKKYLMSLAALMMWMTAAVMTSCSNDLDEVAPAKEGNVVTITIAPPTQEPDTRVTVGNDLKITGWELGDKVKLYYFKLGFEEQLPVLNGGIEFTCINANAGTFSGILPEGKVLSDYNLAVYGATATTEQGDERIFLIPTTRSSAALKDVVMMAAISTGGNYTMKIVNNVLKVTSCVPAEWTVAWFGKSAYGGKTGYFEPSVVLASADEDEPPYFGGRGMETKQWAEVTHYAIADGQTLYINMCQCGISGEKWTLADDEESMCEYKTMQDSDKNVSGRIYSVTLSGE